MMRAFWGLVALLLVAAAGWLAFGRGGAGAPSKEPLPVVAPAVGAESATGRVEPPPARPTEPPKAETPATTPKPVAEATAPAASAQKQTGIAQAKLEASFKNAFPNIAFAPAPQSDGRRRTLGTLGQARVPALEMVGDERDLSQVSAVGAMTAGSGAPAEHVSFAAALLSAVAPDWTGRDDWLRSSLTSAQAAEANFKADHVGGPLNVHFASWRSLGVYRLTVETVEAAAQSAAMAAGTDKASTSGSSASNPGQAPVAAKPASEAGSPSTGASIETKADGSLIVDGKYALKGAGTKESPYKLTWDQLVSAQDDYVPRDGRKEIPSRISMLDGKWVEITGYVAFPLMVDAPDECLSMMNQWDGCCIGVPPTPYDAVEVRLTEPVSGNARLTTYGTVRGRFKVDPHLVGGWLVGLYLMDETTLTPQTYGGFSP